MKKYKTPELKIELFTSETILAASGDPEYMPSDASNSFKSTTYVLDWNE